MGMFDSFYTKDGREVQLKAGPCLLEEYRIGDSCDLSDGIYHALDNDLVIIYSGSVYDVGDQSEVSMPCNLSHFTKWGEPMYENEYD